MKSFFVKQRVANSKKKGLSIISKIILFSVLLLTFISPIYSLTVNAESTPIITERADNINWLLYKDRSKDRSYFNSLTDDKLKELVNEYRAKDQQAMDTLKKEQKDAYDLQRKSTEKERSLWAKGLDYFTGVLKLPEFLLWKATLFTIKSILSLILGLIGSLLDFTISFSINFLSTLFPPGGTSPLTSIWVLIRDIINIFFIFILLYVSITKIIRLTNIDTKKIFQSVIVSALLINFSMFITKIIIDAGNLVSTSLFNQITVGHTNSGFAVAPFILSSISFEDLSKLTNFFSLTKQADSLTLSVLEIILICVTISVFFKVIIMFIGRTVALIVLLVTSPIGFFSISIPILKEKNSDWWKLLTGQILVMPIFLFFLLIITKVVEILPEAIKKTGTPELNMSAYFTYILIISMLIIAEKETKKRSGAVGEMAIKAVKGLATAAVVVTAAAVTGGAALLPAIAGSGSIAGVAAGAGRGARVAGALRNYGRTVGNFAMGKYDDAPGVKGMASKFFRKTIMSQTKDTSGIDLKSIEKDYKDRQKQAKENIKKQAEELGPQELIDKKEKLENTIVTINTQAETQMTHGTDEDKQKVKENNEAEKEHKKNTELLASSDRALQQATIELNNKLLDKNTPKVEVDKAQTKFDEIKVKNEQTRDNFDTSKTRLETAKTEFETRRDDIAWGTNGIASQLGTSLKGIEDQIAQLKPQIIIRNQERNEFIAKLPDMGFMSSGMMSKEDRQKLAEELRSQKGKYKPSSSLEQGFIELAKKAGITIPATETKPAPAPTTKTP
jgi:hypothetical protein